MNQTLSQDDYSSNNASLTATQMNTSTPLRSDEQLLRESIIKTPFPKFSLSKNTVVEEGSILEETNTLNEPVCDKSVELFPFSPISCPKNVPPTLLPFLDTPNAKWTSSILTSFMASPNETINHKCSNENDTEQSGFIYTPNSLLEAEQNCFKKEENLSLVSNQEPTLVREALDILCSPVLSVNKKNKKKPRSEVRTLYNSNINKNLFPNRGTKKNDIDVSLIDDCSFASDLSISALEQVCMESENIITVSTNLNNENSNQCMEDKSVTNVINDFSSIGFDDSMNQLNEDGMKKNFKKKERNSFTYPGGAECKKKLDEIVHASVLMSNALSLEENRSFYKSSNLKKSKHLSQGLTVFSQFSIEYNDNEKQEKNLLFVPAHYSNQMTEKNNQFNCDFDVEILFTDDKLNEFLKTIFNSKYEMNERMKKCLQIIYNYRDQFHKNKEICKLAQYTYLMCWFFNNVVNPGDLSITSSPLSLLFSHIQYDVENYVHLFQRITDFKLNFKLLQVKTFIYRLRGNHRLKKINSRGDFKPFIFKIERIKEVAKSRQQNFLKTDPTFINSVKRKTSNYSNEQKFALYLNDGLNSNSFVEKMSTKFSEFSKAADQQILCNYNLLEKIETKYLSDPENKLVTKNMSEMKLAQKDVTNKCKLAHKRDNSSYKGKLQSSDNVQNSENEVFQNIVAKNESSYRNCPSTLECNFSRFKTAKESAIVLDEKLHAEMKTKYLTDLEFGTVNFNVDEIPRVFSGACISTSGFQTAKGKAININKKLFSKMEAKYMSDSENLTDNMCFKKDYEMKCGNIIKELNFNDNSFHTAPEKANDIDQNLLIQSDAKYMDNSENEIIGMISTIDEEFDFQDLSDELNSSFCPVQIKHIQPCTNLPTKNEIENDFDIRDLENKKNSAVETKLKNYNSVDQFNMGFRTAKGKAIDIDKSLLTKMEAKYMTDQEDETIGKTRITDNISNYRNTVNLSNTGFCTANGKAIDIDQSLLTKMEAKYMVDQEDETIGKTRITDNISNYRNTVNLSNTGFCTANGKAIDIDQSLLTKMEAKYMVDQEDETIGKMRITDNISNYRNTVNLPNTGFCTANGKAIDIDKSLLTKMEAKYMTDQEDETIGKTRITDNISNYRNTVNLSNTGFCTANGKAIDIDQSLLTKMEAKYMVDQEDETIGKTRITDNISNYRNTVNLSNTGFCTANGKAIDIDQSLLTKMEAKYMVDQEDETIGKMRITDNISNYRNTVNLPNTGFCTENGKAIDIDQSLLTKMEAKYMVDQEDETIGKTRITDNISNYRNTVNLSNTGFCTAKGKAIDVDENLFTKMETKYLADSEDGTVYDSYFIEKKLNDNISRNKCGGFRTAKGKTIDLDKNVLAQMETKYLKNVDDETVDDFMNVKKSNSHYSDCCFQTANGKEINLDEKKVNEIKKKYLEDPEVEMLLNFPRKSDHMNTSRNKSASEFCDFRTATQKPITINEELISEMRTKFMSAEENESNLNLISNVSSTPQKNDSLEETKSDASIKKGIKCTEKKFCSSFDNSLNEKFHSVTTPTKKWPPKLASSTPIENSNLNIEFKNTISRSRIGSKCLESSKRKLQDILENNISSLLEENEEKQCNDDLDIGLKHRQKKSKFFKENSNASTTEFTCNSSTLSQSFNLSREIMESTDAFMYDLTNDNTTFVPADSSKSYSTNTSPIPNASFAKSTSPILSRKNNKKSRLKKNRKHTQNLSFNPLNVEYSRKCDDKESSGSFSLNSASQEQLDLLKTSFVSKTNKRKESLPSDLPNQVIKKSRILDDSKSQNSWREKAAVQQQNYINDKPAICCRPTQGARAVLISKESPRITLKEIGINPKVCSLEEYIKFGVQQAVLNVNSENAGNFIFTREFLSSEILKKGKRSAIIFGDEAPVVLNSNNEITFKEISRAFLASPGVDPKLISATWISNHYRWIIWKLASMEKSFPQLCGGWYLTVDNVLFQLKYKYECEIDNCRRSALKMILEGDHTPSATMVLCVATIKSVPELLREHNLELTDGWYSIFARVDSEMNELILRKKVVVGTKLIISNAELSDFHQGCDPLEANNGNIRLKISTNSTRRARWHTKLGFYQSVSIPTNSIKTVLSNGGLVSRLSAVVVRVYPILFLEKNDSTSVLYNEKVELKRCADYEKDRQVCIETILSQVTREVLRENAPSDTNSEFDYDSQNYRYEDGEKLQSLIRERIEKQLPERFSKRRQVSSILKLRLIDCAEEKNEISVSSAILSIWNPTEDMLSFFKEGKSYNFYCIVANGVRNNELQLSTIRTSKYDINSSYTQHSISDRCNTTVDQLINNQESVKFGEVDMVGVIIKIEKSCQTIYLADLFRNIFAISFRVDSKNFDYGDVLRENNIIACINLQWKKGFLFWKIPMLYASEFTMFICNITRYSMLQESFMKFHTNFKNVNLKEFAKECEQKIQEIANSRSSYDMNRLPFVLSAVEKNNSDKSTDVINVLDESENKNANSTRIQYKIEKLKCYGEPPPLSPITLISQPQRTKLSMRRKSVR